MYVFDIFLRYKSSSGYVTYILLPSLMVKANRIIYYFTISVPRKENMLNPSKVNEYMNSYLTSVKNTACSV